MYFFIENVGKNQESCCECKLITCNRSLWKRRPCLLVVRQGQSEYKDVLLPRGMHGNTPPTVKGLGGVCSGTSEEDKQSSEPGCISSAAIREAGRALAGGEGQ